MVVVGHQAVGHNMHRFFSDNVAKLLEKIEIVFSLEKNILAVVTSIVEMVILPWYQVALRSRHGSTA
jgi:hypothetical protein